MPLPPDTPPPPADKGPFYRSKPFDPSRPPPVVPPPLPTAPIHPPSPPEWPADDPPAGDITAAEARELRALYVEAAKRRAEALVLYEPLPIQDEFHGSTCRVRLLRGSNRAGKTLTSMIELARACTGQDPHQKYPAKDGRAYLVGKDLKHIGEVLYRKLFRPGAFKIIRDSVTGVWRAYRPWQDMHRKKEAKPAPPLIPPRMVAEIAWLKKAENIPSKVVLTTGWEVNFFSSLGKPPQGADLDTVVFDEEIVDGEWYPEMSARLLDRGGKFWWGATPQAGTDRLYELHLRCEREAEDQRLGGPEPTAKEYVILLADNPHIDADQKRAIAADLDDASHAVRVGGEFAVLSSKVYPEYAKKLHAVDYFEPPDHWAWYAAVDPGRQVCAALFLAVPPPGEAPDGELYLMDELYLPDCDAPTFGLAFARKVTGRRFEAFIIDHRMGRQTEIASGKTVEEQYAAALAANGAACRRTGSAFDWGSDDVAGGIEACRSLLRPGPSGRPRLRVCVDRCPNFEWELVRYRYKRTNGIVTDVPEDRGRVHAMACLRYLAMGDPRWVEVKPGKARAGGAVAAFRRKQAKLKKQAGGVRLGPNRSG